MRAAAVLAAAAVTLGGLVVVGRQRDERLFPIAPNDQSIAAPAAATDPPAVPTASVPDPTSAPTTAGERSVTTDPDVGSDDITGPTTSGDQTPAGPDTPTRPVAPVTPTTTATPSGDGTLAAPLAIGTGVMVGEKFEVTVLEIVPDATTTIVDHDPDNDPPPDGFVYMMVRLQVTYLGDGETDPYFELLVGARGEGPSEYDDLDCIAIGPDDMFEQPSLTTSGTTVGTFCVAVPSALAPTASVFVEERFATADTRRWWSAS
jgi:hypothetical protein